jgi:hypothetical protein
VRSALENGEKVAWRFTPGERRLSLTLPAVLGGGVHVVEMIGGYEFQPLPTRSTHAA